jgi:hypothetical protein
MIDEGPLQVPREREAGAHGAGRVKMQFDHRLEALKK